MFISSAKQVARWSSCFLAFAIGFAPSARSEDVSFFPWGKTESDRATAGKSSALDQDKLFSSRPGFSFRSIFVPPQYADQAETPLPLSWWEKGSDSPVAIAIGAAEGTRKPDGSRTAAYYWHTDPGNAADNFGSFSFQHFRPHEKEPVQRQEGTDNKRWVSARRALPEVADRRQMQRLRRFHDQLVAQAKVHNLKLSPLELLNGLDLANQSELAALDSWGYIDRLNQAKQMYEDPDEQILQARTWSYWHPTLNRWDASGLGNTQASITRDQRRRANAVKQVLTQEEGRPALLEQLDLATIPKHQRGQSTQQNRWTLTAFEEEGANDGNSGFVEQPLGIETQQPLLELLRETQTAAMAPEQQADIALAEALAFDEEQAEQVAATILAVESEVELLLSNQPIAADESVTAPSQEDGAIATTVPALAPGWESGLLMASIPPVRETPEVIAAAPSPETPEPLASPEPIPAVAVGISDQVVAAIAPEVEDLGAVAIVETDLVSQVPVQQVPAIAQAPVRETPKASTQAITAEKQSTEGQSTNQQSTAQQSTSIAVQLPSQKAPLPQASSTETAKAPALPLNQVTTLAIATPDQSTPKPELDSAPNADLVTPENSGSKSAQAPSKSAVTTGSVSLAAVTEKSSEAIANQAAKTLEPEPPPLSDQTIAVTEPATEAAMAAAEGLLTQHIDLAEREAAEAAAKAAAERAAAQQKAIEKRASPPVKDSAQAAEPNEKPRPELRQQQLQTTVLSNIMTTHKVEADQVADAIIFFDGLTD